MTALAFVVNELVYGMHSLVGRRWFKNYAAAVNQNAAVGENDEGKSSGELENE